MEYNTKLKKLTDKIYQEGIEKANDEAKQIINKSEQEASRILEEATKQAKSIISNAQSEASFLDQQLKTDLKLSAQQSVGNLKKEITELIQTNILTDPIQKAFDDQKFMQKIMESVISNWKLSNENISLELLLPESTIEETEKYINESSNILLKKGLTLKVNNNIQKGFEVLPQDGNYKISISDTAFEAFLKSYFKERVTDILFKEENSVKE